MWAIPLTLAVIISYTALSAAQQSNSGSDDSITLVGPSQNERRNNLQNESSNSISGIPPTSTTPIYLGTKSTSKPKPNCECVPYYLCRNKRTPTRETVIDLRGGNGCPHYLDVCCIQSDELNEIEIPPFTERKGCGFRYPNGIGFKIIGNTDNEAQFGEFPWMVAIMKEQSSYISNTKRFVYQCGGSLIHERVVLTAAQCVNRMIPLELRIRAGEWDTQTGAEILQYHDRKVEKVILHEKFNEGILANDFAILILSHPFDLRDNVDVVCLPEQSAVFDRSRCIATGWGKDKFNAEDQDRVILKKVELPLVPHSTCQNNFRKELGNYYVLHHSFVCAGDENDRDRCKGDPGSPLVCPSRQDPNRYQQVGIVTERIDCGLGGTSAAYANVAYARKWIDEQMALHNLNEILYTF